ncbi:TBC1 domain family member 7-like [Plakobranchus ocellatus]|uniref:TBC1 domain family member 7 n=1 Tax=Plakobranchus ocellatus TaxID=259542 RepID=A0AAV4E2V7_9GAST|nr:TBC1 domain family member 7-like [Plakobranchus ocellatus]
MGSAINTVDSPSSSSVSGILLAREMADQERNFRSQYYDKVGFRSVEEKRSIENLLKEQPMKHEKLAQFCIRFGLPAMYRLYVWKILLGILPANQTCQDFVWFHRQEQVRELERATILLCPDSIDGSQEYKVLIMKLVEEGKLPLRKKNLTSELSNQHFMAIVRTVSSLVTSEADLFWISTRFFCHVFNVLGSFSQFPEYTMQCLMKEDKSQKLYQHLCHHQVVSALPLHVWFHQCFASVLPEASVERIWDRVIGGSSHILVFVAVAIFLVLRRPLLAMQSSQDIVNYLKEIPEDCGDRIVNEALNLFQEYGLTWPMKEDSPVTCTGDSGRSSAKALTESGRHSRHSSGASCREKAKGDSGQVTIVVGGPLPLSVARRSPSTAGKGS